MTPTTLSRTSSMSSTAPILVTGLPSELLTKILLLLPLSDLLAVASSCSLFRSLYLDSAVLQYSYLLQLTHMRDASPTSVSALERYNALKERDQRWRSLTWKRRQTVEAMNGDRGTLYDLLGGVLALGVQAPCQTLEFYKLPTTRGGTDVPHTSFTPGFTIKDFTMDPSQDLLCLIEVVAPAKGQMPQPGRSRRHTYRVHLYTLSTFEPHPLAKEQILSWPFWVTSLRCAPFISIQDGMVALHANAADDEKTEGGVAIYDWKRGVLVAAQPSSTTEIIESYSFIAPALFLVAVYNVSSDKALLNLYAFDPTYTPSPPTEPEPAEYSSRPTTPSSLQPPNPSPMLIATYHLPHIRHRPNIFTIRLDPSPGVGDSVPPAAEGDEGDEIKASPMFMPDGQERIVLVDLQFIVPDQHNQWQGVEERYSLFVLKSTLIKALRHFPHLDPEGSGPKLDVVAPPTLGLDTAASAGSTKKLADVVAEVEAETEARDSIDMSDGEDDELVIQEGDEDDGDEEWEDAEEDWESEHGGYEDEDSGDAVQYGWHDWADRCRILHNLPLPHAWVLFIYHCKFVHAIATAIPADPPHNLGSADIAARVLDFSPNSIRLLAPSQHSANFSPSPTVYVPPAPDPQPPLEKREDGDVGRLIRGRSVIPKNEVWGEEVRTSLEYVERDMPTFMREGPMGGEERLSGLVVDEQRLVWVKRNTSTHNLVLDVHMF